ncbi:MAG: O-methyltransferase [Verrucomicrobia bacterium]|nr:O-methyltransferase [Verrucomicrobiota bacterium]MDA1085395.1 O-methyltransferase [Verrucomicrobiota bacterium]
MSDKDISSRLGDYLVRLVPQRPAELRTMEAYAREHRFPIIGPAAGYLCFQIARMINATRVFELGSGYGYSTAWFARAVRENTGDDGSGSVHHVVWDEALSARARDHLAALGHDRVVRYTVGEAVTALRETDGSFDLIFNDIDKEGYPASLPVIEEKLRPGGVLIIDNMIWHGAVFDSADHSAATAGVREITRLLTESPGWDCTLVPIRDGLIVAWKRPKGEPIA